MSYTPLQMVGIMGNPLEHTLSPAMQNAWFRALDLPFVYFAFPVEPSDFPIALEGLQLLGARGVNITLPYKREAWSISHILSPEAERARAVNTFIFEKDFHVSGHNTDVLALEEGLTRLDLPGQGGRCLVLGSGGAAAAALAALDAQMWDTVLLCCRNSEAGEILCHQSGEHLSMEILPWEALEEDMRSLDLLIHATSLGLPSSPWPEGVPERILDHKVPRNLVDFVYSPGTKTPLISWSQKRCVPCVTGEELLVAQGAEAFRLFTGKKLPKELRHLPADCLPKEES